MFCENCGYQLRGNAAFCPKCGTAVKRRELFESSNTQHFSDYKDGYTDTPINENNEPSPDDPSGKKKRLIIIVCVALSLVIAIGAVIVLVVINSKSSPDKIGLPTIENSTEAKITEKVTEPTQNNSTETTRIPTYPPATEAVTETSFAITQDEIEAEIEKIRTYYYTPSSHDVQKVLENGQDGWHYSRDYRFHDGKLVFAFVYDGTEEHRLYFKDDHMIRYIDENHTTYDYPETAQFSYWENKALSEAYTLIESDGNDGAEEIDLSAWLGTWTASTGENLEIYDVSEGGLMLRVNKLSESGSKMSIVYPLEFDDSSKTVASEFEGSHDYGWEYTFILGDGYITVKSRYPDQLFYKD